MSPIVAIIWLMLCWRECSRLQVWFCRWVPMLALRWHVIECNSPLDSELSGALARKQGLLTPATWKATLWPNNKKAIFQNCRAAMYRGWTNEPLDLNDLDCKVSCGCQAWMSSPGKYSEYCARDKSWITYQILCQNTNLVTDCTPDGSRVHTKPRHQCSTCVFWFVKKGHLLHQMNMIT